MVQEISSPETRKLFQKLADVEDIHKKKIIDEYSRLTGSSDISLIKNKVQENVLEGGMTTEEYIALFSPDLEKESEVISLAMSIEAQALDLYTRAAWKTEDTKNSEILGRIAGEEKLHLEQLGKLLDTLTEANHA
jgi:rubrerythrin